MPSPCPSCRREVTDGQRFCGHCGADVEATRVLESTLPDSGPAGRFAAGTVIAERYRIVGLLGRGGMGEVYRADDLRLARPVALKFLPEHVERDPSMLNRMLNEVRTALSVSHPNVCRVHDVHHEAGRHFVTMEFVDGDDLSALLRRIGRLPSDKALEISRQLCAGLGAAHAAGILHRDLKPANIMIDGRGQVKITDFGLAGLAGSVEGVEVRSGTPAYMAPEQLAGKGVGIASDLYSLGLVLYEIYTGKTAHEGRTPAEIAKKRMSSAPTSPSSHVTDIDPAVERVILRCLERDPGDRPPTALAVSAALPGGDPLAAALAAGETPAPELVAEAGAVGGLAPARAWTIVGVFLVCLGLAIAGTERYDPVARANLPRSGVMLEDDARKILDTLGYGETERRDSIFEFLLNENYLRHVGTEPKPDPMSPAADVQPAGIKFGYRQSPRWIEYESSGAVSEWVERSLPTTPGEIRLSLDPTGRLIWLDVVPPERPVASSNETDWEALLEVAGFEAAALSEVAPAWLPPRGFDDRRAWEGSYPDAPDIPIRIEAASLVGRPVAFRIVEPWTVPLETAEPPSVGLGPVLGTVINLVTLAGAAFLAWRNVRLGRGDRRTALRFALAIGCLRFLWYPFARHIPAGEEQFIFAGHLAWALFRFGRAYIVYLAVEPYARKLWPRMLTSWVRLFDGRLRDPLIGRDVLVGLALATAVNAFQWPLRLAGERFGLITLTHLLNNSGPNGFGWTLEGLRGLPGALLAWAGGLTSTLDGLFMFVILVLVARLVMRRDALAAIPVVLIVVGFGLSGGAGFVIGNLVWLSAAWYAMFRGGLLTVTVFFLAGALSGGFALTYDLTAWWAAPTWIALGTLLALAVWSFRVALAGQPVFRDSF